MQNNACDNSFFYNVGSNILMFVFGHKCNLSCKYCLKRTLENEDLPEDISPIIFTYLKYLHDNAPESITINYYGGEPLLYIDNIKRIVEFCNQLNKDEPTRCHFFHAMISNGKCLNEDIVEFLNDNNFIYTISYDGYSSEYSRGYNAIKDKGDLIYKVKNLHLSGVVNNYAYPDEMCKAFQEVDDKYFEINKNHIAVNFDDLLNTGEGIKDFESLDLNYDKYVKSLDKLFEIYKVWHKTDKSDGYKGIEDPYFNKNYVSIWYIRKLIKDVKFWIKDQNREDYKYDLTSRCGQGLNVLNMDMDGNLYDCHNVTSGRLGNIVDSPISILKNVINSEYKIQRRKDTLCRECEAIALCNGGCKYIDEDKLKPYCDIIRLKFNYIANKIIELVN